MNMLKLMKKNRQEKANAGNVTQKIHPPLKLHTPEVIEAYRAHYLPRLYLMGTNMTVMVY